MEGIFHLNPQQSFTITTLEAILAGELTVKYTPSPTVRSGTTSETGLENFLSPAGLKTLAIGLGAEMPTPITRLFLLLQADTLLKSGPELAAAATRLLEFCQYDIFPQVFTQGLFATPTAHLLQPVFGEGKVYYQGYLLQSADIHDIFSWQPISWHAVLPASLEQDSSFGLSYALYSFSQFQKIYRFAQALWPQVVSSREILFSDQITQLAGQIEQALTKPHHLVLDLSGLTYQLEKLLAKFGEHLAQAFGQYTPEASFSWALTDQLNVTPAYLCQLIEALALENLFLYQSGSGDTYENTTQPTLRLLVQPYRLLQNLEQLVALLTMVYLTESASPAANQNIPPHWPSLYRNQVLNVLKGVAFDELIRKTITFMYTTV